MVRDIYLNSICGLSCEQRLRDAAVKRNSNTGLPARSHLHS